MRRGDGRRRVRSSRHMRTRGARRQGAPDVVRRLVLQVRGAPARASLLARAGEGWVRGVFFFSRSRSAWPDHVVAGVTQPLAGGDTGMAEHVATGGARRRPRHRTGRGTRPGRAPREGHMCIYAALVIVAAATAGVVAVASSEVGRAERASVELGHSDTDVSPRARGGVACLGGSSSRRRGAGRPTKRWR